jgi:hypothetical protein
MVKYNVGNSNPADRYLGTYVIRTKAITRGKNEGTAVVKVYQVRKSKEGQSWSLVKKLNAGRPYPLSARLLDLVPDAKAQKAYEDGNDVFVEAAFDQNGENPTSFFKLKRRKDGAGHVYYYSNLFWEGRFNAARSSSPKKGLKKAGRRTKKAAK